MVYDPLEIELLDSNVYFYGKDYYKCSNRNLNEFYKIPNLQKNLPNLNLERIFQYRFIINLIFFKKFKTRSQQIVILFTCSHTVRTQITSHIRYIFIYIITSHKRTHHITTNLYILKFFIFFTYFK